MKKFALALAVVFSVALVSCGNKNAEAVDSDTIAPVEEVTEAAVVDSDSNAADSTAAAATEVAEVPAEPAK